MEKQGRKRNKRKETGSNRWLLLTWSVGFGPLRVQRLGPERGPGLQLGFGELRQVRHDRVLVHVRVDNLLWGDDLERRDRFKPEGPDPFKTPGLNKESNIWREVREKSSI